MGLLDSDFIRNRFGSVLSSVYGDGRLIRVTKVRGPGGVQINQYQQPVAVKVQTDRCDEAMRQQAGYTESDAKLLILQAGVGGPMLTTDDIIEHRGQRWSIYGCGEDPAQSYWRGRGVRQATDNDEFGWVFEFGHWDDGGTWRTDLDWVGVTAPFTVQPITDWMPVEAVQQAIIGIIMAAEGDTDAMTWAKATAELNAIGAGLDVEPIVDGETGASVRAKINAIVEAL